MLEKIYLHLLILCCILYHGIIATLPDEGTRKSSELLVREKRVISHLENGLTPTKIEEANYMVNIKQYGRGHCAGAILTHYTVITAAFCVPYELSNYTILSGSGYDSRSISHTVTSKEVFYGKIPNEPLDGIALVTVDPPFQFHRKTGYLNLHVEPVKEGTKAFVSGWGCVYPINPIPGVQRRLRTITLSIMNHADCQAIYHGRFNITAKHLCTYNSQQHCARTDGGAPLVVGDNNLVGIHIWKGEHAGQKNPDVFLNVQNANYNKWIKEHSILI